MLRVCLASNKSSIHDLGIREALKHWNKHGKIKCNNFTIFNSRWFSSFNSGKY